MYRLKLHCFRLYLSILNRLINRIFPNNRTEKMQSRVSLSKCSRKPRFSASYKLKVPNFFTLPEYGGTSFEINSISFQFAKATWCFQVKSHLKIESMNGNVIKLFAFNLMRIDSEISENRIFYYIYLLDDNDKITQQKFDHDSFSKNFENNVMAIFNNEENSYNKGNTLTIVIDLYGLTSVGLTEDHYDELLTTDRGTSLSQDFRDVLLNGEDHNLILSVKDKKFRAHRDILRARSDVFRSMLSHDMIEKNSGVVDVPDCDPEAFEQLLLYFYTGKAEKLDESNMFGLYYAADKYNIANLKEYCSTFIKNSLSVTNVCEAIELASKHSDQDLLSYATDYFTENANNIFLTLEWQLFMKENSTVANELIIKSFNDLKCTESPKNVSLLTQQTETEEENTSTNSK